MGQVAGNIASSLIRRLPASGGSLVQYSRAFLPIVKQLRNTANTDSAGYKLTN